MRHGQGVGSIAEQLVFYIVCKYIFGKNARSSWVGDFSCIDKMYLVYFAEKVYLDFASSLSQEAHRSLDIL